MSDASNSSNERNPHAAWLRQFAEFIRDVISPSEKQHLQHCADLIDRDEVETSPPLTDSERAMIQTWPNLNNHVKALEKWIDQIEDICYDKVMHYREKVEQIGRIIDCEIPEPSETNDEPYASAIKGLGNLLRIAVSHIDMPALEISHHTHWALLTPFLRSPEKSSCESSGKIRRDPQ